MTLPFSSTTTSICTIPDVRILRAVSGYLGDGRLRAIPLSTPPDTGLSKGRGAGGGALSPTTTTFLLASTAALRKSAVTGWAADNLSLSREEVGTGSVAATFSPSARFADALGLDAGFASFEFGTAGFDCDPASSVFTELTGAGAELPGGSIIFAIVASR